MRSGKACLFLFVPKPDRFQGNVSNVTSLFGNQANADNWTMKASDTTITFSVLIYYSCLGSNRISTLESGAFDNLSRSLLTLRLSKNRITQLPVKAFKLPRLTQLWVEMCTLIKVEQTLWRPNFPEDMHTKCNPSSPYICKTWNKLYLIVLWQHLIKHMRRVYGGFSVFVCLSRTFSPI